MDETNEERHVEWNVPSFRCAPGYVDTELLIHFFEELISIFRSPKQEANRVAYFKAVISTGEKPSPSRDGAPSNIDAEQQSNGQNPPANNDRELVDRVAVLKRLGFSLQRTRETGDKRPAMQLKV